MDMSVRQCVTHRCGIAYMVKESAPGSVLATMPAFHKCSASAGSKFKAVVMALMAFGRVMLSPLRGRRPWFANAFSIGQGPRTGGCQRLTLRYTCRQCYSLSSGPGGCQSGMVARHHATSATMDNVVNNESFIVNRVMNEKARQNTRKTRGLFIPTHTTRMTPQQRDGMQSCIWYPTNHSVLLQKFNDIYECLPSSRSLTDIGKRRLTC